MHEAANQQAGSHQQDQSHGGFGDNESVLHPMMTPAGAGGARAITQRGRRIDAGHTPGRQHTGKQSGGERYKDREGQYGSINCDLIESWQVRGNQAHQYAQQNGGEADSRQASANRKHERFDQHLAENLHAARAHCRTHSYFRASPRTARQQQPGNIGTSDEQDQHYRGKQDT